MTKIRIAAAVALVAATVLVATTSTTASADDRVPTTMEGGSFLLDPAPNYAPTFALPLRFEARWHAEGGIVGGRSGHTIFFSAGGQPICTAVTDGFGTAGCEVLGNLNLGTVLALLTGQAKAEYRGNALLQPSSVVLPMVGPSLGPILI